MDGMLVPTRIPAVACVAVTILLTGLAAQERIDPRCFLLSEYRNVVQLDLAAMRRCEIWDDLVSSGLSIVRGPVEAEIGSSLDHIDRLTMVIQFSESNDQGESTGPTQRMFVLEGNAALAMPAEIRDDWQSEPIGEYTIHHRQWSGNDVFVRPHDRLLVWGARDVIVAALAGERRPAVPCADVMSLAASRDKLLGHLVADLRYRQSRREFLDTLCPDAEWPADDAPTFFAVRLLATGDADDPHVAVDLVLRHAKGDKGLDVTEQAVDVALARGLDNGELRLLHGVLKSAEKHRSGSDLLVRFDLGRSRTAVGTLAFLALPLLTARTRAAQAMQAAAAAQEAAAEAAKRAGGEQPKPAGGEDPKPGGGGKPEPAGGGGGMAEELESSCRD